MSVKEIKRSIKPYIVPLTGNNVRRIGNVSSRQRLFVISSRSQVQTTDTASTHLQAPVPITRSCSIVPLRHQTSSVLASFLDSCSQIICLFKLVPVFGLASLASLEEDIISV